MVLEKIPTFSEVQTWVNNNADVPNADHADTAGDADTVGGQNYSDIQNWVNNSADVPNADQADNADTLDGEHAGAFADVGHIHDSRYYTKSEADSNFVSDHNHDGRYARLFNGVQHPVFSSVFNVPRLSTGESVVIDGDGLYIEDGT